MVRRPDEPVEFGQDLSILHSSWKGFNLATAPSAFQGLAWTTRERHSDSPAQAADILGCVRMFEELTNRASKLPIGSNDHELIVALRSNQVLTPSSGWNYLQWDHHDKTLKPSSKEPISSEEASKMIQINHQLGGQPELIHRFSALKPLQADQLI